MRARLSLLGGDILCERDGGEAEAAVRIPLIDAAAALEDWARRYRRAVASDGLSPLAEIGADMFGRLDETGWASRWALGAGDRMLEVAVDEPDSAAACALLDAPWELLARKGDFLAADPAQPFIVFRSIGRHQGAVPAAPAHRDLALMFMAASPEGLAELDFEAEEAALLEATRRLPVQVVVEESGCAEFLKDRLALDGPFEVVHVSCHGDILPDGGPALALETAEGTLATIAPGDFARALGEAKAPLVFLSACRTAEAARRKAGVTEPFVRALVRAGVPNVLGWDGSVYDRDAIQFARVLYGELARHGSVPFAAAAARRDVLAAHRSDPHTGLHWHLARVYAGPSGAGACCDRARPKRPLRRDAGFREFLDIANRRVPVATAQEFVGRRRQAQAVIRALRDPRRAGVLIFGMGNLGKSSLAARVANRLPRHRTVVAFERYDAPAIFGQLVAALPGRERANWEDEWRDRIRGNGAALGDALEDMLRGPFDTSPVLLVIDDLEQILEAPTPAKLVTPVRDAPGAADAWRISMAAVLRAFVAVETDSRLLITSRFDFTLPDGRGGDLADALEKIQLLPMIGNQRAKQWRAAARLAGRTDASDAEDALVTRAQAIAGGNPGLQQLLCRPILAGERDAARRALDAVEHWRTSGEIPSEESAAREFFRRVSFETYRDALTAAQRTQLRASTLFSEGVPVPVAAHVAAGEALGAAKAVECLDRLIGLGLVDDWGEASGVRHAAVNTLARSLAGERLTPEEESRLATAALPPLARAWRDGDGDFPQDPRSVEAARLALLADVAADLLDAVAEAAGVFLFYGEHDARSALDVLKSALAKMEGHGGLPRPGFLLLAANCADRIGETGLQIALLEKGLALSSDDKITLAQIAATHAEATIARDGPEKALATLSSAARLFEKAGDLRSRAITVGKIADILQQRGETDEALRIRREEELPVYERLGDVRERAIAMGKIADILQQRGETDEALRIRREEALPVFERLGDVRARAVALGRIADLLERRGEPDEGLRIRREE